MSDEAIRVEFKLPPTRKEPAPRPEPGARAERWRREREARRARQLALAYHIDHLIRSGAVPDLATVARMCGVSRARVSQLEGLTAMTLRGHEQLLSLPASASSPATKNQVAEEGKVPACNNLCVIHAGESKM